MVHEKSFKPNLEFGIMGLRKQRRVFIQKSVPLHDAVIRTGGSKYEVPYTGVFADLEQPFRGDIHQSCCLLGKFLASRISHDGSKVNHAIELLNLVIIATLMEDMWG